MKKAVPIPTEVGWSGILNGEAAPTRCQTSLKSCSKALNLVLSESQPGKTVENLLIYWCAGRWGREPTDGKQTVLQEDVKSQEESRQGVHVEKRFIIASSWLYWLSIMSSPSIQCCHIAQGQQ